MYYNYNKQGMLHVQSISGKVSIETSLKIAILPYPSPLGGED